MSAAAHVVPVDRMRDWLEELERILKAFDALPSAAQEAVNSVIESLALDPNTSDAEIAQLNTMLARYKPSADDGRQQRPGAFRRSERATPTASHSSLSPSSSAASANFGGGRARHGLRPARSRCARRSGRSPTNWQKLGPQSFP